MAAEKKNGNSRKKMGSTHEHDTHAKGSMALEAIACAITCVKEHQSACCQHEDHEGFDCCDQTLSSLFDALDTHSAHLRKCCGK